MARARGFKWDNVQKKQFVVDSNGVETTLLDETGSGGGSETASIATSTTSPSNPVDGDLWFDTTDGTMYIYYDDGTSSQWVGISGATGATGADGGVTSYTDIIARNAAPPPSTGDLAYITSTGGLYIWDSSEWDRIWAGPDVIPTWTTELSNDIILLNTDGTPTTLTVAATDAEGFDITYTYDTSPSNQAQATIVNNNDGTFTLTPSTTASDIGDFILRVKATDGLQVISTTATARLVFSDDITFDSSEIGITTNSTNYVDWAYSSATNVWGMGASSELTSGRKYLEIEILPDSTAGYFIGLARSDLPQMSIGYNDPTGVVSYNQGAVWTNATYFYPSPSFYHVNDGDVFQIAYDNTTNEVWFNKNNTAGAWWPSDPSSGTGHLLSGTSGQPFRLVFGSGGGSTARIVGDIKTGSKTLSYPLPTGFSTH